MDRSRKIWFLILAVIVGIFTTVYMVMVKPLQKEAKQLDSQYRMKLNKSKRFLSRAEGMPSERLVKGMIKENELLNDTYKQAVEKLGLIKEELLPESATRPSIYWLDVLRKTRIELTREARESGVEIPTGLSFKDDIPSGDEVPTLLRRLTIVEELVSLVIRSGTKFLSDIKLSDEEIIKISGEDFLRKVSISFSVKGSLQSLINFIHCLEETDSLYIIQDMEIQGEGKILAIRLVLSMFSFLAEEEEPVLSKVEGVT